MKQVFIYILFIFFSVEFFAQQDSIYPIGKVTIYSSFSKKDQAGFNIQYIPDSILKSVHSNFSDLLRKNANIYFKQQGNGMLASISMRGSNASHTGVFWNGIPINSNLNGQTDFNVINPSLYNTIRIRNGGGSTALGSGAIGGAINLVNTFNFNNKTAGVISGGTGSYKTYQTSGVVAHSSHKTALYVGMNLINSKNDYPYLGTDLYNKNGELFNYSIQTGIAYKINTKNQISYKNRIVNSDRNTSGTLTSSNNAKLIYRTNNHLFAWKYQNNQFNSELKTAFSKEAYSYYFDKNYPSQLSDNQSTQWYADYLTHYSLNKKIAIISSLNMKNSTGSGTNITEHSQTQWAFYTELTHHLTDSFVYSGSFRKQWSSLYQIPLLFSVSSKKQWSTTFATHFNFSNNFRVPTFNDLYWQPGGNENLLPEKSINIELGSQWKTNAFKLQINIFASQATDLIQWKPTNSSLWQPTNIQDVIIYGLDYKFSYNHAFNSHFFSSDLQYSYTVSQDQELSKQLPYVPYHLANLSLSDVFKKWELLYNLSYNGLVYTTTSNTMLVPDFWLSDVRISKSFLNKKIKASIDIRNIFNKKYQIVSNRPMPNRNYSFNIQFKF